MSGKTHQYDVNITWTGNHGPGTTTYTSYGREHEITAFGAPTIAVDTHIFRVGSRSRRGCHRL